MVAALIPRVGRALALVFLGLFFPFIYIEMAHSRQDLLCLVDYRILAGILPFLGFVPLILTLFFLWGNGVTQQKGFLRWRVGRIPRLVQGSIILGAMFLVMGASELPLTNGKIGIIQYDLNGDSRMHDVARGIYGDLGQKISVSFSRGMCRIYFDNQDAKTQEKIEETLTAQKIPFEKSVFR